MQMLTTRQIPKCCGKVEHPNAQNSPFVKEGLHHIDLLNHINTNQVTHTKKQERDGSELKYCEYYYYYY
jgi:hypothetical protein